MKEIRVRSWSVFSGTLVVCLIQAAVQEHDALAQQNEPVILSPGSAIPAGYALTNGGVYRHKSCIIPVPKHATLWPDMVIRDKNRKELKKYQRKCAYPAYRIAADGVTGVAGGLPTAGTNGYVAYNYQWAPSGSFWTELVTEMLVPPNPNDRDANVAFWSGLSPQNSPNLVLQPEIIWGSFAYNGGFGAGNYQMLCGAQFTGAGDDLGYYICSSDVSGDVNDPDGEATCDLTNVNFNDTVEFGIQLANVTSGCSDELTASGMQNVCGDWALYELVALDETSGEQQSLQVVESYDAGADAPPNGGLFPLALPVVYESYNDTGCESGTIFNVRVLDAYSSSSVYTGVPYSPTLGASTVNNPGCNDSLGYYGTLTTVN
jgi:hypothetical protein